MTEYDGIGYPHRDSDGFWWLDPTGLAFDRKPCFWCGRQTIRVDVSYEAPFCDSQTCNKEIALDLMRINAAADQNR